jgi:hypothetical protein
MPVSATSMTRKSTVRMPIELDDMYIETPPSLQ